MTPDEAKKITRLRRFLDRLSAERRLRLQGSDRDRELAAEVTNDDRTAENRAFARRFLSPLTQAMLSARTDRPRRRFRRIR